MTKNEFELLLRTLTDMRSELKDDIREIREDVKTLRKVVTDGNGQPAIVERLATVEERTRVTKKTKAFRWWTIIGPIAALGASLFNYLRG